ncbi:MAG TPA: Calx-beta domain-containing protein [Pyrinomonadaceae bacterium]|jgi:CSLREA domain-containing protein
MRLLFRLCCALSAALALSISVASSQQAAAVAGTTFTVDSTADAPDIAPGDGICADSAGACTLRAAIREANSLPGDDTINFSVTGTISLTGALPTLATNMTLNGAGSGSLTIRRETGGDYRIFTIDGVTVGISGLTVTNGRTPDGFSGVQGGEGGGISNFGTLTLTDVAVTANSTGKGGDGISSGRSGGTGGAGGGIYNAGTLTMTECAVTGNTTGVGGSSDSLNGNGGDGGGLYNTNTLTMTNCVVSGNSTGGGGTGTASGAIGGGGGGIFSFSGSLNLTNVAVSNNVAGDSLDGSNGFGGSGGGLYLRLGTATLLNSSVSDNRPGRDRNGNYGRTGGIDNGAVLNVIGSTISGNTGYALGAAISNGRTLTMANSTVSGNTGIGIASQGESSSSLILTNCTITGNSLYGVFGFPATVGNNIIAGNGSNGQGSDVVGSYASRGHNLIGNGDGGGIAGPAIGFNAPGDRVGTSAAPINPLLGALVDNGGATLTHAPLAGSPALDAGDNAIAVDASNDPLLTDQRGAGRIADSTGDGMNAIVDIGAFEFHQVLEPLSDKTTDEDTPLSFLFNIGDAEDGTVTVNASSDNQALVPDANLTVSGSNSMRRLEVVPAADRFGTVGITLTATYSDNVVRTSTFTLTVVAVNDAPVNHVPGTQSTIENQSISFSEADGNALSVSDVDAGAGFVRLTLTATNGTITLASTSGLSFSIGDGAADAAMTFTGSIEDVNAALDGLSFMPSTGFNGTANLQISTDDLGHNGSGGALADTDTVSITVLKADTLRFSMSSYNVSENVGQATITVTRTGSRAAGAISVDYATSNGTATAGADYTTTSGTLTFALGETTKTFSIPIIDDPLMEENEFLRVHLSNPTGGAVLGIPADALLSILQNDSCNYSINLSRRTSPPAGEELTVNVTAQDGCAWTAASNNNFISVTSGAQGRGNGVVTLSVAPNGSGVPRTGTVTIAGLTLTITQPESVPEVASIYFDTGGFQADEGAGRATIYVRRRGNLNGTATVEYLTSDDPAAVPCDPTIKRPDGTPYPQGIAYARCDYATTIDTVTFAPGESVKEIYIPLIDDAHVEGGESVEVRLRSATGAVLVTEQSSGILTISDNDTMRGANPIFNTAFFVRQHYLDFLSREPEANEPWSAVLNGCSNVNNDPLCDRIKVSQSFFGSPEFRLKGFFVYNLYRVAFGRLPEYREIILDMRRVSGETAQDVYARRAALPSSFTLRQEFKNAYDALNNQQYVETLLNRYTVQSITTNDPLNPESGAKVLLTRADLVNRLSATGAQALTRAQVLRAVAESDEVGAAEYNGAFVAMQYYGYLRRTPDEAGYQSWLRVINQDPNNVRIMVNGFMNSVEYRLRFGQP